jgi:hypothetical protein
VSKFARTDQRKLSFSVRTADRWNRLPDEIKQKPGGLQKETKELKCLSSRGTETRTKTVFKEHQLT